MSLNRNSNGRYKKRKKIVIDINDENENCDYYNPNIHSVMPLSTPSTTTNIEKTDVRRFFSPAINVQLKFTPLQEYHKVNLRAFRYLPFNMSPGAAIASPAASAVASPAAAVVAPAAAVVASPAAAAIASPGVGRQETFLDSLLVLHALICMLYAIPLKA